jgi:hypothetical protein
MVPNPITRKGTRSLHLSLQTKEKSRLQTTERFGDDIPVKKKDALRIAFQNIGGFPTKKTEIKEEYIKDGLRNWDVDIFGLVKTNLDWRLLKEEDKLWL